MAHLLMIDDDERILRMVSRILSIEGYEVTTYNHYFPELLLSLHLYDLILLDIMMPDLDGFDVMRMIRDQTSVPIIYLTSKVQEADLLLGLGLGADDYIKKPFSPDELKARIASHLRREQRLQKTLLTKGNFRFDLKGKQLYFESTPISLTKGEYQICEYLALHSSQVFTKEQIFEAVFGFDKNSDESTITTHIKNIRSKLTAFSSQPIQTVWGIGYKWEQ